MRMCSRSSFEEHWNKWITCEKDSPVAVLLCHPEDRWDFLPEDFWFALQRHYPMKIFTCSTPDRSTRKSYMSENSTLKKEWLREISAWGPKLLIGLGEFHFLQEVCRLRWELQEQREEERFEERISLVLFPVQDCQRMLSKKVLWIRNRDGSTSCLRYCIWETQDVIVLPGQTPSGSLQRFQALLVCWEKAFFQEFTEIDYCPPCEGENLGQERLLWEELAEPLWLRYGIPLWIGLYYSYLYLYRLAGREVQKRLDSLLCDSGLYHADWELEEAAERYCRGAVEAVWLPKREVDLLAGMAMTGIEMLPEQRLSWQQVKKFYRSLCR